MRQQCRQAGKMLCVGAFVTRLRDIRSRWMSLDSEGVLLWMHM